MGVYVGGKRYAPYIGDKRRRYMGGGEIDYSKQYLTFKALQNGTFKIGNATQYSVDKGATWISLAANTNSPTISAGDTIVWKATLTNPDGNSGIGTFSSSGNFEIMGNPLSLVFGDNFRNVVDLTGYNNIFRRLFRYCSKLYSAENLSLPATTLSTGCYREMFDSCSNIIAMPELPAMTLASLCYNSMFNSCSKLTSVCELPATTLVDNCYSNMFKGCSSLTTAPNLPATQFANSCYSGMFTNCTSLVNAPEISLTGTYGYYCMYQMFMGCTNLEIAPILHATTLTSTLSLGSMFNGCSKLKYIKAMFTTAPGAGKTNNWVSGVASEGIFVKNSNATWENSFGDSAIPTGWTVQTASE